MPFKTRHLLRRALHDLCERFGGYPAQLTAPRLLMESAIVDRVPTTGTDAGLTLSLHDPILEEEPRERGCPDPLACLRHACRRQAFGSAYGVSHSEASTAPAQRENAPTTSGSQEDDSHPVIRSARPRAPRRRSRRPTAGADGLAPP